MEPLRVLIVDDYEPLRRSIRSLLLRNSWSICGEASDGIEAIEKAKTLKPDVVIMGISMPRMNGIEATRIIGKEVPGAKVIIVSQNDPTIVRGQVTEIGARDFVLKGDIVRDLIPALNRLNHHKSRETGSFPAQYPRIATDEKQGNVEKRGNMEGQAASEQRFREIIDALPAAIYTTDAEGNLTHFNPAAV